MRLTIQAGYAPGETGMIAVDVGGSVITLSPEHAQCSFDVNHGDLIALLPNANREADPPALPGLADALLKAAPVATPEGNG